MRQPVETALFTLVSIGGNCAAMPLDTIINIFHSEADNVGDQMCGPAQYLWPTKFQNIPLGSRPSHHVDAVVIGGGQIFSQMSEALASIYDHNPRAKAVAWGVGLPPLGRRNQLVTELAECFAAFGTRNYDRREQFSFVPCASCLSPLFDRVGPATHDVVAYVHRKKRGPEELPPDIPIMTNSMRPLREVIEFIASGDTVVTSSYHGVYWAQLLGRKVICLPYNDKFETFQHSPTMAEPGSWLRAMGSALRTEPMLEEYRALNQAFAVRAMDIWCD